MSEHEKGAAARAGADSDGARAGFLRRTLVVLAAATAFVAIGLLLWNALDVFLLAFAAVLLATFLHAPAQFVADRTKIPHGAALGGVVVLLLAFAVGFAFLVGPRIVDQATQLAERLPSSMEQVQQRARELPGGNWLMNRMEPGGALPGSGGAGVVSSITGTASMFWDVAAKLIFVIFLALYLAAAPLKYRDGLASVVPPAHRDRATEVLNRVGRVLRGWLLGQLVAMVMVGLLTWLGLTILGIPLALVLGLIAGMFEFIPILGPVLAFVPAFLLALTQDATTVLWVVVLYVVIQQIEGNLIVPLVQRSAISLPPALTISAVFVAGAAFGPVGLLVATPLAAVGLVLYDMLYRHDLLGEHVKLPGGGGE